MGLTAGIGALIGTARGLNRSRREREKLAQNEFENRLERLVIQIRAISDLPNASPEDQQKAITDLLGEIDAAEAERAKSLGSASPFRKIGKLLGFGGKKKEAAAEEISPEDIVSGGAPPEALIPPAQGEGTGAEFGRPGADFPPVGGMPVGVETQASPGVGPSALVKPPPEFGPGQRTIASISGDEQFDQGMSRLRQIQEALSGSLPPGQQASFDLPGIGNFSVEGIAEPPPSEQLREELAENALAVISNPDLSPEDKLRLIRNIERGEQQEPQLAGSFQAVASNVAGKIISTREEFDALPAEQQKEILKRVGQEKPPPASQQALDLRKKVGNAASRVLNAVRAALLPGAQGEEKRFSDEGIELFKEGSVTGEGGQLGRTRVRKTPQEIASELIQTFGFSDQFFRENSAAIEAELLRILRQQGGGGLSAAEAFAQVFGSR